MVVLLEVLLTYLKLTPLRWSALASDSLFEFVKMRNFYLKIKIKIFFVLSTLLPTQKLLLSPLSSQSKALLILACNKPWRLKTVSLFDVKCGIPRFGSYRINSCVYYALLFSQGHISYLSDLHKIFRNFKFFSFFFAAKVSLHLAFLPNAYPEPGYRVTNITAVVRESRW